MKLAFVFPGQGSQTVAMMDAYSGLPEIRETFVEASDALGEDLWSMVADGPAERLSLTTNTQPVMLTAGVAVFRAWRALGGGLPALVAGHSLGEYSALVAAGSLKLADAVRLVRLRAQAMQDAVPAGQGAMAAILGLAASDVIAACSEAANGEVVQAVNFNAPEQTVIAGHAAAVGRAVELLKGRGAKRAVPLPVSAPFHCSLMKPAAERLAVALKEVVLAMPCVGLVNNADATVLTDPASIAASLVRQAAAPVRWVESIQVMAGAGVTHVVESGPGKVLAGLAKRCDPSVTGIALADKTSVEKLLSDGGLA